MAYPPTLDTEDSLSPHLSGTCLGSPLLSVWVSGPVCAPTLALGLFQDLTVSASTPGLNSSLLVSEFPSWPRVC